jgi:hypothetical protein
MIQYKINPEWIKKIKKEIREEIFVSHATSNTSAARWLILYLSKEGIPFKVFNLGAGIKRISLMKNVCPHCKGRGYIDNKELSSSS